MIALLITTLLVVLVSAVPIQETDIEYEWTAYKQKYRNDSVFIGGETEEAMRRTLFEKTYRYVTNHNLEADQGLHTYRVGINQFADMTDEEYKIRTNYQINRNNTNNMNMFDKRIYDSPPDSINWLTLGKVTSVKDQGQCGSCYVFGAVASIESLYAIHTGKLLDLSEQQVVDCIYPDGDGCAGGDQNKALDLIGQDGGIELESDYPYVAKAGICAHVRSKAAVSIKGPMWLPEGNETALKIMVALQPVAIGINASGKGFGSYKSGIYWEPDCKPILDHVVLVFGYGTENGQDYWLIKNSWSADWGDKGFMKMARNKNNMCGVASDGRYPIGAY